MNSAVAGRTGAECWLKRIYHHDVGVAFALLAGLLAGCAIGVFWSRLRPQAVVPVDPVTVPDQRGTGLGLARRSIEAMHLGVIVLDPQNEVVILNDAARQLRIADEERVLPELLRLARSARHDGRPGSCELDLFGELPEGTAVRAQASPLGISGHVALFVQDISESRRVEAVRRDFVANVSHELKTPVGALALLSEAILDGYDDDPADVRRFAERMRHESSRLARLVQELIDLSRLQGGEPPPAAADVPVSRVISEVIDRTRLAADSRKINVIAGGRTDLILSGDEAQLVTAMANLVDNAIAYSPEGTRVAIGVRSAGDLVEVTVSDEGMGIPAADLERVFERFYRADPARARATGGTGLGLAIVKHIATNHGGSVTVWSTEGAGSTFTLRLPASQHVPVRMPAVAVPESA